MSNLWKEMKTWDWVGIALWLILYALIFLKGATGE